MLWDGMRDAYMDEICVSLEPQPIFVSVGILQLSSPRIWWSSPKGTGDFPVLTDCISKCLLYGVYLYIAQNYFPKYFCKPHGGNIVAAGRYGDAILIWSLHLFENLQTEGYNTERVTQHDKRTLKHRPTWQWSWENRIHHVTRQGLW